MRGVRSRARTNHLVCHVTDTILLVENDCDAALPLCRTLEREGYRAVWVGDRSEVLQVLEKGPVHAVILVLPFADADGVDVCRSLRERGYVGAIIIVTSRACEIDRVVGLDSGADDYLTQPFGLAELHARLRAVLRRTRQYYPADAPLASSLTLDVAGHRVHVGKTEIQLTNKEFGLLAVLEANRNKVVARTRLMSEVWHENWYGSPKTLDVTVGRLRNKLEQAGVHDRIVAIRGVGFRLERTDEAS
jgi:DNA-binding response OmpR family regulator